MPARIAALAGAGLAAVWLPVLSAVPAPAAGRAGLALSVPTARPAAAVTVSGVAAGCAGAASIVLHYVGISGADLTGPPVEVPITAGRFRAGYTVPADATSSAYADQARFVASCRVSGRPLGAARLTISGFPGALTVTPGAGSAGTPVRVTGTNCRGGGLFVQFVDGSRLHDVTLDVRAGTFSGVFTIPPGAVPGPGEFSAGCRQTTYSSRPFTIEAAGTPVPTPTQAGPALPPVDAAPPAVPLPRTPRFTG